MKISVTPEIIERARHYSSDHCPIALAISEALGGAYVYVSLLAITVSSSRSSWKAFIPSAAEKAISDFDAFREVEPFDFDLPIPDSFIRERRR